MTGKHALPLLGLLAAVLSLPACTSLDDFNVLGYSPRSRFARDVRTVRVPIFVNKTVVRDLEFQLTDAVIRTIETRTPWKVVEGDADLELTGTIVSFVKRDLLQNTLNEVRQGELTLSVQVAWRDLRTGQDLTAPDLPPPVEPLLPAGAPMPRLAPPPPGPGGLVLLQRSATFIPELGQSYATARQKVMNEMADNVVNVVEMRW